MFKMLIVGFLESIGSERAIALRCADGLTIRRFLGYSLTEQTPKHSSFTVFRQRLPLDVFDAVRSGCPNLNVAQRGANCFLEAAHGSMAKA